MGNHQVHDETGDITQLVLKAAEEARAATGHITDPEFAGPVDWPVSCTIGPGLEGAIACESSIGYVSGSQGRLIYRGYDIFDLCAYATFEQVCYLVLHGALPTASQLEAFTTKLSEYRRVPKTMRQMMGFPIEEMNSMSALRLGTSLMRYEFTYADRIAGRASPADAISADEDSIPMETMPYGQERAIYEFKQPTRPEWREGGGDLGPPTGMEAGYHLIAGVPTIAAAIARMRNSTMPLEPDLELSHAANYLYMITGRRPTPLEERIMDIALILHIDHGMNASTFAAMVVASTLSDFYLSVGAGIAALTGPLHGGANEQVVRTLNEIGSPDNVKKWYRTARAAGHKIAGFGHRVYKAYDPRSRVLGPVLEYLARENEQARGLLEVARALEREVVAELGPRKGVYPNVDFFSGMVYRCLGIPMHMFTPTFAVSRVAGWTARMVEYLVNNRLFRPRAIYVGPIEKEYLPLEDRE